jgi:hypothetical protein
MIGCSTGLKIACASAILIGITGCAPKQGPHSRAYLEAHLQTLRRVLKTCRDIPGARGPACVNAYAAEEALAPGPIRNLARTHAYIGREAE